MEAAESGETFVAPFVCPFTGHASNGVVKFVILQPCGHVMSQRAIKEMEDPQHSVHRSDKGVSSSTSSSAASAIAASTAGPVPADSSKSNLGTDKRQCLMCHQPYNSLTEIVELASEHQASPTSAGDHDRKLKKRAHDQQTEPKSSSSTATTALQSPPEAKRAKLS